MTSRFSACVLALLHFCCYSDSYEPPTLPDVGDPKFIEECVRTHNRFRSEVNPAASNMLYMKIKELKSEKKSLRNKERLIQIKQELNHDNCPPRYVKMKTMNSGHFHLLEKYSFKRKYKTETPLNSWDPDLATTAKAWAKKCLFKHNTYLKEPGQAHPKFTPVGENLWTGSISIFTVQGAITSWHDEVNAYNYATSNCRGTCGHYTQIVWATSYKVGCAVHFCPSVAYSSITNAAHFICNYGPAGNYPGRPYKTGTACSDCNGEQCVGRLCQNAERDKVISGSRWRPDWDRPACDEYCITVIALRTLLFILTILATWLLPKYWPLAPASE